MAGLHGQIITQLQYLSYLPAEPAPFRTAADSRQYDGSRRSTPAIFWISFTLLIRDLLRSLTLPHLLYYDLCVLMPAGALLLARPVRNDLRQIAICGWIAVSGFLVPMLAYASAKMIPLILESILTILFFVLLRRLVLHPSGNYERAADKR
jgi:hypothetical protein